LSSAGAIRFFCCPVDKYRANACRDALVHKGLLFRSKKSASTQTIMFAEQRRTEAEKFSGVTHAE